MDEKQELKRLLIVTPRYPPREGFPMGIFVKNQVDVLKKYFKRVVVISTTPYIPKFIAKFMQPRRVHESLVRDYKYENVEVYYTRDIILPFESSKKKWGDKALNKAIEILDRINFKPDIIHGHFTWPSGYVAVKLKEIYQVPAIITAHGYDIYDLPFRNRFWKNKIQWILNNSDHIITVSRSNLKYIEKLNIQKLVSIIPNGFDDHLFYPRSKDYCREKLKLPLHKKIILSVGNLVPVKGHVFLVRALKNLVEINKFDLLLVIVGDGPERKNLIQEIKKCHLQDYVMLPGSKPHNEIPLWMNAADLFVLPSLSEGNPTVMFEALGVGLPFVGTAVGGVPEIITSEDYGLLCPPKDPKCLAEKILIALEKDWDREKIRKYTEQFTWENIAKQIISVYEKVLDDDHKNA